MGIRSFAAWLIAGEADEAGHLAVPVKGGDVSSTRRTNTIVRNRPCRNRGRGWGPSGRAADVESDRHEVAADDELLALQERHDRTAGWRHAPQFGHADLAEALTGSG